MVLGAATAVVLIAVAVAVLRSPDEQAVRPSEISYSDTPLRGRAAHTATLLPDGRVLIVGGCATNGCTTAEGAPSTEFYVPGRGFTAGPELRVPRDTHTATLLADGRVLVAGGWTREGTPGLDSAEVYQPGTGRFEPVGSMAAVRGGHTATLLPDGRVLVVGGRAAEIFDPGREVFTAAAPPPQQTAAGGAIALRDGRVLLVGGPGPSALYDPGSDRWTPTGSLQTTRDKFALALLPDGRVLVLGGAVGDRRLMSTEIYDPATGEFAAGPGMDTDRYKFSEAVAVSADGRVIVGGGTQMAAYDGEQFRPIAGTSGTVRWLPTVTGLPGDEVLLIGGYDERVRLHPDALLVSLG
jgi:hypothetical protein